MGGAECRFYEFYEFYELRRGGVWELRAVVHGAWCMVHGFNAPVLRCRSVLRSEPALSEAVAQRSEGLGFCVHQCLRSQRLPLQPPIPETNPSLHRSAFTNASTANDNLFGHRSQQRTRPFTVLRSAFNYAALLRWGAAWAARLPIASHREALRSALRPAAWPRCPPRPFHGATVAIRRRTHCVVVSSRPSFPPVRDKDRVHG